MTRKYAAQALATATLLLVTLMAFNISADPNHDWEHEGWASDSMHHLMVKMPVMQNGSTSHDVLILGGSTAELVPVPSNLTGYNLGFPGSGIEDSARLHAFLVEHGVHSTVTVVFLDASHAYGVHRPGLIDRTAWAPGELRDPAERDVLTRFVAAMSASQAKQIVLAEIMGSSKVPAWTWEFRADGSRAITGGVLLEPANFDDGDSIASNQYGKLSALLADIQARGQLDEPAILQHIAAAEARNSRLVFVTPPIHPAAADMLDDDLAGWRAIYAAPVDFVKRFCSDEVWVIDLRDLKRIPDAHWREMYDPLHARGETARSIGEVVVQGIENDCARESFVPMA